MLTITWYANKLFNIYDVYRHKMLIKGAGLCDNAHSLSVLGVFSKSTTWMCLLSPKSEMAFPRVVFPRKHCIMLPGAWNNTWDAVNVDQISKVSKEKVNPGYF